MASVSPKHFCTQRMRNMTDQEVSLVKSSFSMVVPIADTAAALFYNRLFETHPQLKPMFKHDMREQGKKLMATIGTAVAAANKPHVLQPALEALASRHVKYGVKTEHFDAVGAALIWTLEQGLGPKFTAETREAWIKLFGEITHVMLPYFVNPQPKPVSRLSAVHAPAVARSSVDKPVTGFWAKLKRWFGF